MTFPPSGDGEGEERPQVLSGEWAGARGWEQAHSGARDSKKSASNQARGYGRKLPPPRILLRKSSHLYQHTHLTVGGHICLPAEHGHSASATAKYAVNRASRFCLSREMPSASNSKEKSNTKDHPIGWSFVLAPPWERNSKESPKHPDRQR